MKTLEIKLLSDNATVPTRGTNHSAGYDLYSTGIEVIPSGCRKLLKTNVAFAIPEGFYGRIAGRSGLAYKAGLDVLGGVIDSDYRGDVGVILLNTGSDDVVINAGERMAQIIIEQCFNPQIMAVSTLPETVRSEGGFGHTGTT